MYTLPVYFGYLTEGQRHMLQRVLHRASSRGFTPFYYDLDTLAENAHYHLFKHSCQQAHCLYHLYTVKPRPPGAMRLRTRGDDFELQIIKYEFNKRNFIVQSLFNYVWFCILLYYLHFVFYCTHVRMSYVLNSYLLTYLRVSLTEAHSLSSFWTTVCKTVRPMLSDRWSLCSVLSCLSVTLVYCGQTVGRIKMKLDMQVDLGRIALDGDPALRPGMVTSFQEG